jgi:predicted amidophosphoribosyltransferase
MAAFNIIELLRGMRDWIPFPKKKCPNCGTEVSRFASVCPNCGYEFGPVLG